MDLNALIPWRSNRPSLPAGNDDYFDPFVTFRREVDRMFDDFLSGSPGRGMTAMGQALGPIIDIEESERELVVTAEIPGLESSDFDVTLVDNVLTIKGEKKREREHQDGDTYYTERRFGAFSRAVRIPFELKDEKVDAKYDKGVLTIRIPKPAEAQRNLRRIEVKGV